LGGKFSAQFTPKFSPEKMYEKSTPGHPAPFKKRIEWVNLRSRYQVGDQEQQHAEVPVKPEKEKKTS
jgi:hypothetical protein